MATRFVLLASLALTWCNYLLTERWADVEGALHGPREPWFVAALTLTTVLAWLPARSGRDGRAAAVAFGIGGTAFLAAIFLLAWFPPGTWTQIPFRDNWPARYQSSIDQIALFERGAVAGWQWLFLGGYHLSSDVTVSLGLLAWLPVALFGSEAGFHLLHLLLFLALPALAWCELRHESRPEAKWIGMGLSAVLAASYSYKLLGSGDTNSLAGAAATALALYAAHRMRTDRWAGPVLVVALVAITYSHAGFLLFTVCFLGIDALLSRSWRYAGALMIAGAAAAIAGLPLTWETWRYPEYFTANNAILDPPSFDPVAFARKVYYNVELLWLPGRWLNDYTGLAAVFLPVYVFAAARAPGRVRFHAWAALAVFGLTRLYDPVHSGWGLIRAAHMHVVFAPPILAWFIVERIGSRGLAVSLLATIVLYVQISFTAVPHVETVGAFDPQLLDRVRPLETPIVLVENSYHPEMDSDPAVAMEPTPFPVHFEALLASETGQRLYAGVWDGWQWAPARRNLLANGSLGGRRLDLVSDEDLIEELHRWGIRDLFVWSRAATVRLASMPAFTIAWRDDRWTHFVLRDADTRSVVAQSGSGRLVSTDPLGAEVALESARAGDRIVVRTNYYPAWRARTGERTLALYSHDGQLAFDAPASGTYSVFLEYPTRPWLIVVAFLAVFAGAAVLLRISGGSPSRVEAASQQRELREGRSSRRESD